MNARKLGLNQAKAASIAEISERTGQRIEAGESHPNRGQAAAIVNGQDPLEEVWEKELEPMLRKDSRLKPMTLFEYLQETYPGKYPQVLRTLQRRVQTWKALHGPSPEVMFPLHHEPGMMGLSDFTQLKEITVTIAGQPLEHLLYHYRLAYSGWQYAHIVQGGESFIALSEGLQNALMACGGVPKQHRTDSLSAAYKNMRGNQKKALTRLYDELCDHYRMQPTRNNTGIAHENGSIEAPHGHLKNRIKQAVYLRGSSDFATIEEYRLLVEAAVAGLNRQCQQKFEQEKLCLQPLPKYRVPDYELLTARVSSHSTVEVRCMLYTVPSRLIGRQLELRLYHDRILGYLGNHQVVELPRVRATDPDKRRGRCINYRHVIEGLRRKPRAFIYCTWQEDLLPTPKFRELWVKLKAQFELDTSAVLIVEALYIAATQDQETAVADYLERELEAQTLTLRRLQQTFTQDVPRDLPPLMITQHDLSSYDQLLSSNAPDHEPQSIPEPQLPPQAAPPFSDAYPLGIYRTPSYAGAMVL
jgi:DNA-binding XRE family transcriptional regulator